MDLIGIEAADVDQLLDLGHHLGAGRGHHRIEVPRGLSIDQIALGIGFPGLMIDKSAVSPRSIT